MDVQPEPRDDAPHGDGSRWHDAGVLIAGPATTDAEESWDAWWTSAGGKAARRPPPVLDAGKQSVFIAQTAPPRAAIREELVARIQMAEDFVYLENYGIYDPAVITALGQKLKSKRDAGREFEALLLVPHQSLAPQYAWLHYVTYCHLSFMSCSSFSFVEGPNTYTVSKAVDGKTAWSFDYAGGAFGIGNWYEDSTVSWDTGSTSIRNIRAFTGETLMFTLGSARAGNPNEFDHVYLHGKVAIIDDAFAMVGSASFTPRSLVQDGEVAAFIHGDSVASFRAALWSEYFGGSAPAAAGFGAGARANHGSAAGGKLTAGQLYVMPLQFSVPQKEPRGVESWLGTELR
jgi:phosphatidylserine/phosphatidylglycerophosphate/cardiolipin synthase-like enzyme